MREHQQQRTRARPVTGTLRFALVGCVSWLVTVAMIVLADRSGALSYPGPESESAKWAIRLYVYLSPILVIFCFYHSAGAVDCYRKQRTRARLGATAFVFAVNACFILVWALIMILFLGQGGGARIV